MAAKLKLTAKIVEYLKSKAGDKFTAQQIAEWILATYPAECEVKRQSSTQHLNDAALLLQIRNEISARCAEMQKKPAPQIKITEGRPRKYYYSTQTDDMAEAQEEAGQGAAVAAQTSASQASPPKREERKLYPLLAQYLWNEFGIFAMRIEETRSSNSKGPKGNQWLHPDIVGMEDLGAEWGHDVSDCVSAYSGRRARLWSFEVKKQLNRSDVREYFFQTLSNSSWANFSYLVARDIDGGETMRELRMLSAAHGIGLIRLDVENPSESEILIPARERDLVDWDMVNRLAVENKDFREFVGRISRFCKTNKTKEWRLAIAAEWGLREEED